MTPHITVCVCTYKRAALLRRLLQHLCDQDACKSFTYSVLVIDNDSRQSAEPIVAAFALTAPILVEYAVEPRQNIALARNKAVDMARGDFLAFIDDDEFPTSRWLRTLVEACERYGVDGVLGPVMPHFDTEPPSWVVKGRFYERATYPTGLIIDWKKGRTGNVLLKREVFSGETPAFRPECLTGEDQDFFDRMIRNGRVFVWCNEAVAYEVVPQARWKRTFMVRRALLRGAVSLVQRSFSFIDLAKSVVAVPLYTAALPIALLCGQHHFMRFAVKLFDHLGRLLAVCGIHPITEPYVTD